MSNIKKVFTHTPVYFAVLAAVTCFFPAGTAGAKPSFNAAFLTDDLSDADVSDLSRFESGGYQPPVLTWLNCLLIMTLFPPLKSPLPN